jgi:N-acetylglucosaminyl-diphospho-decaprenol L-rhamnosyltransferase
MPDLSVIIVNWNSKDYVRQCLTSLFSRCRGVSVETIVVDNGSFDGCDQMLAGQFPTVVFVQSGENLGFARANNLGVRHASSRYLLFLNPDTEFIENSPGILLERLKSLPDAGAAGCRLLNDDLSLQTSCVQSFPTVLNQILAADFLRQRFPHANLWGMAALHSPRQKPTEVEAISGACILVKRENFERVGGFTESYFMYGEDLDLCFKLRRSGGKVFYVPETSLIHVGGGSTGRAASNFSTVMMRKSVYRFMRLNRGILPALAYRFAMMSAALARLLLIGPMMLFGNRVVRHGSGSLRKWFLILCWSLGLEPRKRTRSPKAGTGLLASTSTN